MTAPTAPAPTKIEAVRQALAAGITAPKDGVAWIKQHYNLDLKAEVFSTHKSRLGKSGTSAGVPVPVQPAPAPASKPAPAPKSAPIQQAIDAATEASEEGDLYGLDAIEAVQSLGNKIGFEKLIRLAEALAKKD